jgi:hypothetical protein
MARTQGAKNKNNRQGQTQGQQSGNQGNYQGPAQVSQRIMQGQQGQMQGQMQGQQQGGQEIRRRGRPPGSKNKQDGNSQSSTQGRRGRRPIGPDDPRKLTLFSVPGTNDIYINEPVGDSIRHDLTFESPYKAFLYVADLSVRLNVFVRPGSDFSVLPSVKPIP